MNGPEGYAKVAHLMSRHNEYGIFRSFSILNLQNLLYMQAEIIHLEQDLKEIVQIDRSSNDPVRSIQERHWQLLSDSQEDGHNSHWRKMQEIRVKLKEYSKSG